MPEALLAIQALLSVIEEFQAAGTKATADQQATIDAQRKRLADLIDSLDTPSA